jgi:hypothetical protein
MAGTSNQGPGWADVWQAAAELRNRTGSEPQLTVVRPYPEVGGSYNRARVCATIDLRTPRGLKPRSRRVEVGGVRGAASFPAAFLRALSELVWSLDDDERAAAEQARF